MEETEDLNRLIQDLNAGVRREATGETGRLERWLAGLTERGGSDLLLVAGAPAAIRVDGRLTPLSEDPLSGEEIEERSRRSAGARGASGGVRECAARGECLRFQV